MHLAILSAAVIVLINFPTLPAYQQKAAQNPDPDRARAIEKTSPNWKGDIYTGARLMRNEQEFEQDFVLSKLADEIELAILQRLKKACGGDEQHEAAQALIWAQVYKTFQEAWFTDPSARPDS